MPNARIVFMGTPEFAVPCLEALLNAGYDVPLVVTQPDKPVGRKKILTPPPVKIKAQEQGIEVVQPPKVRKNPELREKLASVNADLFVVVAYGQILPKSVLDIPKLACINVHASLLPKYRGSAPIQWAILEGESITGVTTMLMDVGMDTGDMLLKKQIPILTEDTGVTLSEKLSQLGAEALLETLPSFIKGDLQPEAQNPEEATVISMLNKEHGLIDWHRSATELYNQIRGLKPWPEAHTFYQGVSLKIKEARVFQGEANHPGVPGQVVGLQKQSFLVRTGDGVLEVLRVHLAGKKEVSAGDFVRGQRLELADIFTASALA